tara:strand:+ start:38434 stop:40194 length:1761 start_codon:yes stop_codon:yes gene_type:complete
VAVAASPDDIKVAYRIIIPRAMLLKYAIDCPNESRTGTLGETAEDYRRRRIAELEGQRQREVQAKASVIGAVVGQAQGGGSVQTPNASADVTVAADGSAIGQSIGEQTTAEVQLSPFDTGARTLGASVQLRGGSSGQCAMRLWSELSGQDLTGIVASYDVIRIVDNKREAAENSRQRRAIALDVRANVSTSLIATGADPDYRGKIARAEAARVAQERAIAVEAARVRRETDARLRAEAVAESQRVARERDAKLRAEAEVVRVAHAREAKLRAEVEVVRVAHAREARLRAEASATVTVVPPAVPRPTPVVAATVTVAPPAAVVRVTPPVVAVAPPPPAVDARAVADAETARREKLAFAAAIQTRNQLIAWLVANGADPYYRARLRQERFNEREQVKRGRIDAQREASARVAVSLRVSLETRETLVAWLVANGADPEYRRKQNEADLADFAVRSRAVQDRRRREAIRAQASAQGTASVSIDSNVSVVSSTPPTTRPAPVREVRTARPTPQAVWIDGFYEWSGGEWVWLAGTWSQPPVQDAIWIPTVEVNLGGRTVIRPGSWRTAAGIRLRVGPTSKPRKAPQVRDHRR